MAQLRWDARKGRLAYIVAESETEIANLRKVGDHGAEVINNQGFWYLKISWVTPFEQLQCLLRQLANPVCSCKY